MNVTNEHGNTALHYACFWGDQLVAEELVAAGALVSIANKDGDTPLDKARGVVAKRLHGMYWNFYHKLELFTFTYTQYTPCFARLSGGIWSRLEEDSIQRSKLVGFKDQKP